MSRNRLRNTRRVAVLVAFAVALLGLPVLPAASAKTPSVEVREHPVRAWNDAPGGRTSTSIAVGDAQVVGASWSGDGEVEWRLRENGAWGGWEHFELPDEAAEGPDDGSAEAREARRDVSMPVPVSGAEAIQVRAERDIEVSLEMVVIDDNGYRPASFQANTAGASAARPGLMPRSEWDSGNECTPRDTPRYAEDVRYGIVHHTAGSNNYSQADAWKQVLGVCKYHRHTLGWDDIGYNILVDKYGAVYEGRAGGLEHPVVGAHAAGFNAGSVGVSTLGCFGGCGGSNDIQPPQAMRDSLVDVMAWKFDLHHIDPKGTTREISGGGGTTTIPKGQVVELRTIIGHKDVAAKACPGDHLYPWVRGEMPDLVRQAMVPALYDGPRTHEEQPVIGQRPRWDVTVDPAASWRLRITDADGDVVRETTGAGTSLDRSWDMRDALGREVAPGTYHATLSTPGVDATPVKTRFEVTPSTERRYDVGRIGTSVELSEWAFDDRIERERNHPQTDTVIIASAEAYPDALVATTLAGSLDAPILLSGRGGLSDEVSSEIRRLRAEEAYVIGGVHRLSDQVDADLRGLGLDVERLAGETRYHTSGKVAWRVVQEEGPKEVLLALGEHPDASRGFQDALVAGAFGGDRELPLLLVHPDSLTEPSAWVLDQRSWPDGVTVVGGKGVISAGVKAAARNASGATLRELAGDGHYDTSRIVADELLKRRSEGPQDPNSYSKGLEVVLATGENWPDSLGAGAAAVARGAAFVLVHNRELGGSEPTRAWLTGHAGSLVHAVAAGGSEAISDAVLTDVDRTIRSKGPHTHPRESW